MKFEDIIFEKAAGVAKITINRPAAYNAFRTHTLSEMCAALEDAELDSEIRVIVLRGAGDKAFCTGGDTQESQHGGYDEQMDYWHGRVPRMIRDVTKPVIAAILPRPVRRMRHACPRCCRQWSIRRRRIPRPLSFCAGWRAREMARTT